jgi:DNA-binding transcriptional regulator YdaS (Cro superfamily)
MENRTVIDEAFEKAGGRKALRDALSVGRPTPISKQTLSDWKRAGRIPASHAVAVERLTGIPRELLCPDFDWGRKGRK